MEGELSTSSLLWVIFFPVVTWQLLKGHISVQSCLYIEYQYKPISLQYSWLSVEQPIRIDWVLYECHWEVPINTKTKTSFYCWHTLFVQRFVSPQDTTNRLWLALYCCSIICYMYIIVFLQLLKLIFEFKLETCICRWIIRVNKKWICLDNTSCLPLQLKKKNKREFLIVMLMSFFPSSHELCTKLFTWCLAKLQLS